MASFTGTFVHKLFTSNDKVCSSFSSFICSSESLVLVSMFAPSFFWEKGVIILVKFTVTTSWDRENRSQRGFFFVYFSLSIQPCRLCSSGP